MVKVLWNRRRVKRLIRGGRARSKAPARSAGLVGWEWVHVGDFKCTILV